MVNLKGDGIGDVKEVVIDPRTGRVAYAVVSFGGFLGMGEKLFAIPFSSFKYDITTNKYVLDVSKERLKAAPGFDADHWPAMSDESGTGTYTGTMSARHTGNRVLKKLS